MLREKKILKILCVYFAIFFAAVLAQECMLLKDYNQAASTNWEKIKNKNKLDEQEKSFYHQNEFIIAERDVFDKDGKKISKKQRYLARFSTHEDEYPRIIMIEAFFNKYPKHQNFAFYFGCIYYKNVYDAYFFLQYLPNNLKTHHSYDFIKILEMKKENKVENFEFHEKFLKLPLKKKLYVYFKVARALNIIYEFRLIYDNFDPTQIFFEDDSTWEPKLLNFHNLYLLDDQHLDDEKKIKPALPIISIFDFEEWIKHQVATKNVDREKHKHKTPWKNNIWALGMSIYILHNNSNKILKFAFDDLELKNVDKIVTQMKKTILKDPWDYPAIMSLKLKDHEALKKTLNLKLKKEIKTFENLMDNLLVREDNDNYLSFDQIEKILMKFWEECPEEEKGKLELV